MPGKLLALTFLTYAQAIVRNAVSPPAPFGRGRHTFIHESSAGLPPKPQDVADQPTRRSQWTNKPAQVTLFLAQVALFSGQVALFLAGKRIFGAGYHYLAQVSTHLEQVALFSEQVRPFLEQV